MEAEAGASKANIAGLGEGRIVHYVAYNGRHLAAIVIGVVDAGEGVVNIAVFSDMKNVNGETNFGLQFQANIHFSDIYNAGTCHYPERV